MFSNEQLHRAGHVLFAIAVCDEAREIGREDEFEWPQANICETVPMVKEEEICLIVRRMLDSIGENWGKPVDVVFADLENPVHALQDLLLGYVGHGVSIQDDYAELVEDLPDEGFGDSSEFLNLAYDFFEGVAA